MGRIRTIKPEFWTDERLSELPEATHILAAALLNYADDEGYFNANTKLVAAACCPLREPSVSVHDSLNSLARVGYLSLLSGKDGRTYGVIVNFAKHQRVNRPTPSKIRDLVAGSIESLTTHGGLTEPSAPEQGTGNREVEQGSGTGETCAADGGCESLPPDFIALIDWWNDLKAEGLVNAAVKYPPLSEDMRRALSRFVRSAALRGKLADTERLRDAIRRSPFCSEPWFELCKLIGGKNRDGKLIVEKLLEGGYASGAKPANNDPRGNMALLNAYLEEASGD